MKRCICILLILFIFLCGCGKEDEVVFYYRQADDLSDTGNSLLSSEVRTVTGYTENLPFLVSLYLSGPMDQDLVLPFPEGTKVISITSDTPDITIQLHELPGTLSDSEYALASVCLGMTVLELTEAETVTVICGSRSVTVDPSLLVFSDEPTPSVTPGGTQ